MLNTWRISWRNIIHNKKRFIFTLLAIALGVSLVTSMLITAATTDDVFDYYEDMYVGNADYWVLSDEGTYPEEAVSDIQEDSSVTGTLLAYDKQAFLEVKGERSLNERSVRITGVDNQDSSLLKLPIVEGELDNDGFVMPEAMADVLGKKVGDTVRFEGMGEAKISATVEYTQLLAGPDSWEGAESNHFRVMAPLDMLRDWTGEKDAISYMRFQVDGDGKDLFHSAQQDFKDSNVYIEPVVPDDLQSNDIGGIYTFVYLIAALSIFISGFIVFNMIYTSVIERKNEFAIMKSMGYIQGAVSKLILMEMALLASLGTIFGVTLGIWFGDLFIKAILGLFDFEMVYELNWELPTLIAVLIGLLFPVIFALFPIYNAGRTPVLLTLKKAKSMQVSSKKAIVRTIIGLGLLGFVFIDHPISYAAILASVILLFPLLLKGLNKLLLPVLKSLFHHPGTMAAKNLSLKMNRNANTAAIMATGISIILLLGAVVETAPDGIAKEIKSTYGGDVKVSSESPWTKEDAEKIQSYEAVTNVDPLKEADPITWETKDGGKRQFSVLSVNEDDPPLFTDPSPKLYEQLAQNKSVLLGDRAFEEWGGEVGDYILMNTPNGEQYYEVIGNVGTSRYTGYVGFMDEERVRDDFGWRNSFDLMLTLDGKMDDSMREQLWSDFDHLSDVETLEDEMDSATSAISGMNELLLVLMFMIIGLASIGTANTLLMNTHERRFEIGTMRALGFTKKQVRNMILAEGTLIGLSGVIGGIITGVVLIYIASSSKLMEDFISFQIPLNNMVLAIIAGASLSICAAWISSRTASKMDIQSSLKEG